MYKNRRITSNPREVKYNEDGREGVFEFSNKAQPSTRCGVPLVNQETNYNGNIRNSHMRAIL